LTALRRTVRDSFALQTYEPRAAEDWEAAYQQFLGVNFVP
jgi:hypothetical protein